MNALAALAFALLGIHIGAHRVLPIGYAPTWSPDAQRIAFVTRGNLWDADADGTHLAKLTDDADEPAWSPNGRRIAFTRDGAVWTIRVDGLDERRLAAGAHPSWSPDGREIVFTTNLTGRLNLWKVGAGGGWRPPPLHPLLPPSRRGCRA